MPVVAGTSRTRLSVHALEERDVPSGLTDTFDTPGPTLGAAWAESAGGDVFSVVAGAGVDGTPGAVSTGTSLSTGRAWQAAVVSADTGASFRVKLDTLVPTLLIVRGTALDTATPTYVAAALTRGMTAEVWDVTAGTPTVRGTVSSGGASYFSGGWATVTLVPTGGSVALRVQREDTGAYLTKTGTWQSAPTDAVVTSTTITGGGSVGVGRAARYSGNVSLDDFTVIPPAPPPVPPVVSVSQNFDATATGARPAGWSSWSADGSGVFTASAARANSPANGFASTGGSVSAARAWSDAALPADVDTSAALYLDGIIPAQVFARGTNLDTATPTYYAVSAVRGLEAKLVKVVNGVETTLGTVKSAAWFTTQWVRVRLTAEGDRLRVQLYRTDTRQWLTPAGAWSSTPDFALEVRDGSITAAGRAGVARPKLYSGTVAFDDFEARPASAAAGPVVTITGMIYTNGSTGGDIVFRAAATGSPTRIEFVLNGQVRYASSTSPAEWTFDSTTVLNGSHTLTVRAFDAGGNVGSVDRVFAVTNPDNDPVPKPTIPRKFAHVRVAQLAYTGNPMGAYEQSLLRTGVDVVIPNAKFMQTVNNASPDTPQLLYSNVSNLYQGLLADWVEYADRVGAPREQAFYHVSQATTFVGTSPSSQPVTWLWSAYQFDGAATKNVTSASRGGAGTNLNFGGAGAWTALGSLEKFRELNVTLATLPQAGWGGVWEYVTAVDAAGNPTAWKTLTTLQDGTAGMKRSGGVTFDPPADWKTATVGGGDRQYYVRFRVTTGTAAQAAQLKTVFGRDYVRAAGTQAGVIPAFDYSADRNGDGYLNDAEYAARAAGKDARFVYESRLFYPYYGQMRFVTNPSGSAVRKWAAEYHVRLLANNPLADGVFMDNATGKLPFAGTPVLEATATFSADSGALIAAVNRAIAPNWVMANTAGGGNSADAVTAGAAAAIEEFLIRPLSHSWTEFGDTANLVARRLAADGSPYLVIDSRSDGGSATDARTQLATLAYYYLLADADRTFLMFYGGESPSTSWTQHWSEAVRVDVGLPTAAYREFATGRDPLSPTLTYKVYARDYENALVLYKPLSYTQGVGEGTVNAQTATTHALGGNYRKVNADGTLGPVATSVTLRNGEGAVLVKA
ncbi:Ig-like domain-containing protein [Urbifossiella limnaea]|uniref:Uncharacterized protein n=1 Tax=Urbifossiella limnaea TaxID=2528023 RepID=A0A517Y0T6_9BACT|nr:Ig-like domain-containing protein [Urbifossiella limnaea]QDU23361.1 hypothetical protein ETAA1_53600 [Urbifossiella limnaea]